jgi:hypothetical protein
MNVYVREYQKFERKSRRRDRFAVRYLPILLVLAGSVVVGKIYVQSVAIAWSERLLELKESSRDLELQNSDLERMIATLRTRERIALEASERLGMVVPTENAVLWLTVLDRTPRAPARTATPRDPRAVVGEWLDALWQEEALALTSQ